MTHPVAPQSAEMMLADGLAFGWLKRCLQPEPLTEDERFEIERVISLVPAPDGKALDREQIARIIFGHACGISKWDNEFYIEERDGCLETADALIAAFLAAAPLVSHDCAGWRTDMENAPKDRPFLVYWHKSDIYGVLEWNEDHWEDQDGDRIMAFGLWRLFELPIVSHDCAGAGEMHYVNALEDLVQCLIDNDPEELVADGGIRVIDVWRKDAKRALASAVAHFIGPASPRHAYSPDHQAMGDCRVCGHERDHPNHAPAVTRPHRGTPND